MKAPGFWLALLLAALVALATRCSGQVDWECVPQCKCIWVSGKKTAECKRQNLTEVPNGLSSVVQHLDLTGNGIAYLPERAFTRVRLENLQKLVMRDCAVKAVHAEAFAGLRIVIEIDLSSNRIRQLHRGTFAETERLRVLLLNQNRLQRLDDDLFRDLHYLQKVELSDNHIVQIGQWTFRNLPGLQTLTLDGNNLTRLNVLSFELLPKLSSLELRRNPWQCDCQLRPFRDWAIQRKLYTRPTACEHPDTLAGQIWDAVRDEQFACLPEIEFVTAAQREQRAELWCRAVASPRPQISWVHRQRILENGTKRHGGGDRPGYSLHLSEHWANLTIVEPGPGDRGEYICVARNFAGSVERNVSLLVQGELAGARDGSISLPLAIGLSVVALLFLLVTLAVCLCYCRRRRSRDDEKGAEAASLDQHGLGEQEKSLITAVNPVVKPPRRYEAPSVGSHGTEMTELNRTLLDNESVFADGVGSVVGVLGNGLNEPEERLGGRTTPSNLDTTAASVGFLARAGHGGSMLSNLGGGTLPRGTTYRHPYPPDLLAFSGGRTSSPTSQTSTVPDSSRFQPTFGASPVVGTGMLAAYSPIGFKTLPHPVRSSSATPYSLGQQYLHYQQQQPQYLGRHAYGTLPRRPRAPSWSSTPPMSPTERAVESSEPVYDNLGVRTGADGSSRSVLSLNKSPDRMRNRPLPPTPGSPEPLWASTLVDDEKPPVSPSRSATTAEQTQHQLDDQKQQEQPSPSARKVPPRPPPKPKKKTANGPLYEDEGEDGTETTADEPSAVVGNFKEDANAVDVE